MGGSIPVLLADALEHGIESSYVLELIERWKVPPPTGASATWPWPLSVRTLGRFEIKSHGKPIGFGRKAPRKSLGLFKALIAFGGTAVPEQTLTDALWPDEDGDAAHGAYAMTLTRLRKLLGDPYLLQQRDSKLSLDSSKCWVDAWTFERCLENTATSLPLALALYKGSFLTEDGDAPWAGPLRELLRSRFVRVISDAARELEGVGRHEQAVELYERGLDADQLAEAFYQGLMRCYAATGRNADAAAIYLRLKQLLSIRFGLAPSTQTEQLFRSLRAR
jgi:DNA-binding SARP family transcriptional activator